MKTTNKSRGPIWLALGLAAIALVPGVASASFVLDTGTPDDSTGSYVLSSSSWLAAQFTTTTAETITSLSAYLTQGVGEPGDTFTFDIDASGNFLNTRTNSRTIIASATGTFTTNGWNANSSGFTVNGGASSSTFSLAAGTYWLALQVASPNNTKGLDAPGESSPTNGTAPAAAFAYAGTNGQFTENGAPAIGLQIAGTPAVPLPASVWLLGSGLLAGLGLGARRRGRPLEEDLA
jgi:hypothetical protein